MSAGQLSLYASQSIVEHVFGVASYTPAASCWLALCTEIPRAGALNEISGGGYQRAAVNFESSGARSYANNGEVMFFRLTGDAGDVKYWAVMDAQTGGNLLAWGRFDVWVTAMDADVQMTIAAGEIEVSIRGGVMSDYLADKALGMILGHTSYTQPSIYVGLTTATIADNDTGSTVTELSGAGYARQSLSDWSANSVPGLVDSDNTVTFPLASTPAGGETAVASFVADASSGGNLLFYDNKMPDTVLGPVDQAEFAAGALGYGLSSSFVTTWRIAADGDSITLPLYSGYNYDFIVDWGDGSSSTVTAYNDSDRVHTYAVAGDYLVTIHGTMEAWSHYHAGTDKTQIRGVENWGAIALKTGYRMFRECTNLNGGAVDAPDLTGATLMHTMFYKATSYNQDMSGWDVSNITSMYFVFGYCSAFNQDIGGWDISNVTDMRYMFYHASAFDQDISGWDTGNVTNMYAMFYYASAFDQDIGGWDVASVTNMAYMFSGVTLSTAHYDSLLIGWAAQSVQTGVTFDAGNSKYTAGGDAEAARTELINTYGWTITDGGAV